MRPLKCHSPVPQFIDAPRRYTAVCLLCLTCQQHKALGWSEDVAVHQLPSRFLGGGGNKIQPQQLCLMS